MKHSLSQEDREFKNLVESCQFPVTSFDHRAHIRLAYVYLTESSTDVSVDLVRDALTALLINAGIDPSKKYHETLTEAWVLAVDHFMQTIDSSSCADDFIEQKPEMLDSRIMMTHYSAELLFSDEARKEFLEPNRSPIPRHAQK
ncbi:MAG: hypothetical protein ABJN62_15680 [Halioglobus sp.]